LDCPHRVVRRDRQCVTGPRQTGTMTSGGGRPAAEGAMGPDGVVMRPPSLDEDPGLAQREDGVPVRRRVAEAGVTAGHPQETRDLSAARSGRRVEASSSARILAIRGRRGPPEPCRTESPPDAPTLVEG